MRLEPSRAEFIDAYNSGRGAVARSRLVADLETPVSAMLKLETPRLSFLLESVEGGAVRGRYSVIGIEPDAVWRVRDGCAEESVSSAFEDDSFVASELSPIESLRDFLRRSRLDSPSGLAPMSAGAFGYMGYDMARFMEKLPPPKSDPLGTPEAIFLRPTVTAIFDAVRDEIVIACPSRSDRSVSAETAWTRAVERIERIAEKLEGPLPPSARAPLGDALLRVDDVFPSSEATSRIPREDYLEMVRRTREYILAGDIFQTVLSQRYSMPFPLPPFALYRSLRRVNPSPFLYYLNFGDFALTGSSPEILTRLRDGKVTVRPLAGTRRRGVDPEEDRALREELLSDPKERAEHLMLLDLGRNDVGRVSKLGSVKVTDSFGVEFYSQVMHIVSNVEGDADESKDVVDVLCAGFPAGTVSGAPKVRAMEIIHELEPERRGPYAGCVGYFGGDGGMDTCIVLRTAIVKDGVMHVQAGAGIVADSVPEKELEECERKASALFRAAEDAVRFAQQPKRGQ